MFLGRMTKMGTPPQNVDKKGDTAFRRSRGFRCTCGRWDQSHGPAGCLSFHGTPFFIYSPSLCQNSQTPTVHCSSYIHPHRIRTAKRPTPCGTSTFLSKKSNVHTVNISDLRTASVYFIKEEPHNMPCILNRGGRIQQQ